MENFGQTYQLQAMQPASSELSGFNTYQTENNKQILTTNRLVMKASTKMNKINVQSLHVAIKNVTLLYQGHDFQYFLLTIGSEDNFFEVMNQLMQQAGVYLVQPDILQQKKKNAFNQQAPLSQLTSPPASPTPMKVSFYLPDIYGATLWQSNKGQGVKIAVIDDGFDLSHDQFVQTKLLFSYDSETRLLDASPKAEKDSHGTKIASILFATNDGDEFNRDKKVVSGMVPLADFIAIRQPDTWTSNTILSFQLAKLSNADVINCSWHSLWLLEPIYDVVSDLARYGRSGKGTAVVFSAGNQGKKISPNEHEASIDKAIVIGAVNQQGKKYKYSNYGDSVDGFFYGGRIPVITQQINKKGNKGIFNGTSLAATIATGYIAGLIAQDSSITLKQIEQQIQQNIANKVLH